MAFHSFLLDCACLHLIWLVSQGPLSFVVFVMKKVQFWARDRESGITSSPEKNVLAIGVPLSFLWIDPAWLHFGFLAKGSVSLFVFMSRKCNFELESFKSIIRSVYEARVLVKPSWTFIMLNILWPKPIIDSYTCWTSVLNQVFFSI